MTKPVVAHRVANKVCRILDTAEPGQEMNHMLWLTEFVDFKGSEVRLKDGSILDGSRQAVPYPACIWDWNCIQSYSWSTPQHINVLELLAFFNFLKLHVNKDYEHCSRILHVFDSRVCSCIVAKGRSSSTVLNRVLRRLTALMLASDLYVMPLWTISGWNFADHGSRVVKRPPKKGW